MRSIFRHFDILSFDILQLRYFAFDIWPLRYFAFDILPLRYFCFRYYVTSIFCVRYFAFDILHSIFCPSIFCVFDILPFDILRFDILFFDILSGTRSPFKNPPAGRRLTHNTFFYSKNFGFCGHFKQNSCFYKFGGQNNKIPSVDLGISYLVCVLRAVSLQAVPLLDFQTFATVWPKIAGGDVTKVAITKKINEICLFFTQDAKLTPEKVPKVWDRYLVNPITGGEGANRPPPPLPASFSALYGKRLEMGTWNFLTFPIHSLGMLYKIFEFPLCAEAPPGPLSWGHVCQVSAIFFKFSETVKIWLCSMDLFIKKLVRKFDLNRSRNNEVITFLNIWWKNGDCYFWPPEPQICGFLGFSKTDLVVHDEQNRMAFTPSKSALRFSRSQGGRIAPPPPPPVNVLQKAHQ